MKNWIEDINRFGLSRPPIWWLNRLFDFDAELVLIPSRQQALYRLARRKKYSRGIGALAVIDPHADTAMMVQYGLIPVTTMIRYADSWDIDSLLQKLRDRDQWAISGGPSSGKSLEERGEKVAQHIEAHEAKQARTLKQEIRTDMDYRSRDAWRSYQARTGQRNRHARNSGVRVKSIPQPSGSTGQQGIVLATS